MLVHKSFQFNKLIYKMIKNVYDLNQKWMRIRATSPVGVDTVSWRHIVSLHSLVEKW